METFRDTAFGNLLRFATKGKVLQYPEEKDPEAWKQYVHHEKSKNYQKYGQTERPSSDDEDGDSSEQEKQDDLEKGKDKTVVHFIENDQEVRSLFLTYPDAHYHHHLLHLLGS